MSQTVEEANFCLTYPHSRSENFMPERQLSRFILRRDDEAMIHRQAENETRLCRMKQFEDHEAPRPRHETKPGGFMFFVQKKWWQGPGSNW